MLKPKKSHRVSHNVFGTTYNNKCYFDIDFFSVIPTQCTYSGVNAIGLPSIKNDVARRFL